MPDLKTDMKACKAFVILLILGFSLSPCSVKRSFLAIFDIQHISTLNKVKTTASRSACNGIVKFSSRKNIISKVDLQFNKDWFSFHSYAPGISIENQPIQNHYSPYTTGNSPPKYILFKRLKVKMV